MSNADAFAKLDEMIERVASVKDLARRAAPDAAEAVSECLQRTVAAGADPSGTPWQARKDGGTPLTTIGSRIKVVAIGSRVFVAIDGYVGRHHLGRARGGVARHVIPTPAAPLPPAIEAAVRKVLVRHFRQAVGGEP